MRRTIRSTLMLAAVAALSVACDDGATESDPPPTDGLSGPTDAAIAEDATPSVDADGMPDADPCPAGEIDCTCAQGRCLDDDAVCEDDVCVRFACVPGALGCDCAEGGRCGFTDAGDALVCEDQVCVRPACLDGTRGCACDEGRCDGDDVCSDDVCAPTDCPPGATGCPCEAGDACDLPGDVCLDGRCAPDACPPGEADCPCNRGRCLEAGFNCVDGRCLADPCPAGELDCRCVAGGCAPGLRCAGDICVDNTGGEGGPCPAVGNCDPGLACRGDRCLPCAPGAEGCTCDDGDCTGGLICDRDDRCAAAPVVLDDRCWSPCSRDEIDPLTGRRIRCDAEGLKAGCFDGQVCSFGSCLPAGEVGPTACGGDPDCAPWQACVAGACRSQCVADGDCMAEQRCVQRVCRQTCAADADCGDGRYCDPAEDGSAVCRAATPSPLDLEQSRVDGVLEVVPRSLSFSSATDDGLLVVRNQSDGPVEFTVRKLAHTIFRPGLPAEAVSDNRNGFLRQRPDGAVPLACVDDVECGCDPDIPPDAHPDPRCRGDLPAQACVAGRCDVPCTAGVDCPLFWLGLGAPGETVRARALTFVVGPGEEVILAVEGAGGVEASRWQGTLEIVSETLNPVFVEMGYRETPEGRWKGDLVAFGRFGLEGLDEWAGRSNPAPGEAAVGTRDDGRLRVANALVESWRTFRRGGIGFDEFEAVLRSTVTGSWVQPANVRDCNNGDPQGPARCYPYDDSVAGLSSYTSDNEATPVPAGPIELPFAVELAMDPDDPRVLSGRIDSATTLHMAAGPAFRLGFETPLDTCTRMVGDTCLALVRAPDPTPAATILIGGRFEAEAEQPQCGAGFVAHRFPWLPEGFERNSRAVPGGFERVECRSTALPYDAAGDPIVEALNAALSAANPIPDGRPRRRELRIIDGAIIDQSRMFLLFEERYASFLGESDMAGFSSYGFLDLRRDPAPVERVDSDPPPAPPETAVPEPDDALAVTCDPSVVAMLGFEPGDDPDTAVRVLLDGIDRDLSPMCLADATVTPGDRDRDGVINLTDNCPGRPNPRQLDYDRDGVGDVCDPDDDDDGTDDLLDPAPYHADDRPGGDWDADGVLDDDDNCPATPNGDQADTFGNDLGDACADDVEVGLVEQPCLSEVGTEAVHVYCEESGLIDGGGFLRDADGVVLTDADGARIQAAVECPRGSDVIFFTVPPEQRSQAGIDAHPCQRREPIDDPTRPPLPPDGTAGYADLAFDDAGDPLDDVGLAGRALVGALRSNIRVVVAEEITSHLVDTGVDADALLAQSLGAGADALEREAPLRGTCGATVQGWIDDGVATQVEPAWACADADDPICDLDRRDLRRGKVFFPEAEPAAPVFEPLEFSVTRAFRYKRRFTNRQGTAVGFAPVPCIAGSDQIPYCYDAGQIEAVRARVDCLLGLWRDQDRHAAAGQLGESTRERLNIALTENFGVGPLPIPIGHRGPLREGFDVLYAELLVMLGDEAFTRAFGSRFDLAGATTAPFDGSAFEAGGIDLSGVAGAEMRFLHDALQHYDEALGRLYSLAPTIWRSIERGQATRPDGSPDLAVRRQNFVSATTAAIYLERTLRASTQKVRTLGAIAQRYLNLDRPDLARQVTARGYVGTYLESVALARLQQGIIPVVRTAARDQIRVAIDDASRRYRAALLDMRDLYGRIGDNLGFFGFPPGYLPFPAIDVRETNAFELVYRRAVQRLQTAREREDAAIQANRGFETDAAQFQGELIRIRNTYENQLIDLCGSFQAPDGRIHPATRAFADLLPDTRLQGDPCGTVGNGELFQALGQIRLLDFDLDRLSTAYEGDVAIIELERQTVARTCGVLEDQARFSIRQGLDRRNLEDQIFGARQVIDRTRTVRELVGQSIFIDPVNPVSVGAYGAYQAVTAGTEAVIVGAEANIRRRETELAQLDVESGVWELGAQCAQAEVQSAQRTAEMFIRLAERELELARAEYQLRLAAGDVQRLRNRAIRLQLEQEEAEQLAINIEAARNDPNVRIYRNDAVINAEVAFDAALREAYRATLVFEFYTSQSFARRGDLFLIRLAARGERNLENYLIELDNAFFEFEEQFGLPDTRLLRLSLLDDIMAIPDTDEAGMPLSDGERRRRMRALLADPSLLDERGYISIPFGTRLDQLSPVTRNHKIRYIEASITMSEKGDDIARLYLQYGGTNTIHTVDDTREFYRLPPRLAVLNPFFSTSKPFDPQVYQSQRLRDRPVTATDWRLLINLRDEVANQDMNLQTLEDIKIWIYYTDFTEL